MDDARRMLLPAAIGVAAAVTTLYGVGVFTVLAATTTLEPSKPGAPKPARPPPPPADAAALAAGRRRAGLGLPGDAADGAGGAAVRSTTSSGVGAPGGGAAVYESSKAVDEYLLFHYGAPELLMPYDFGPRDAARFPARCAELVAKHAPAADGPRAALDIGCAVGGASFELARTFDAVTGIDFSHAFIAAAKRLQGGERLPCTASEEGTLSSWFVASAPAGVDPKRITFRQGDACALPAPASVPPFGPFHAILASNLLCRLPDPQLFLNALPGLLAPGGVAVLVSPYSWLEEYTPQAKWLGGCVRGGADVSSAPELRTAMEALGFALVEESNMPFLIREHARKFQWGCSHATVWRRKEE